MGVVGPEPEAEGARPVAPAPLPPLEPSRCEVSGPGVTSYINANAEQEAEEVTWNRIVVVPRNARGDCVAVKPAAVLATVVRGDMPPLTHRHHVGVVRVSVAEDDNAVLIMYSVDPAESGPITMSITMLGECTQGMVCFDHFVFVVLCWHRYRAGILI